MLIPEEVVCKTCEKVFCCSECREKHELKSHLAVVHCVTPIPHFVCPICEKKPLILHDMMHSKLLSHIVENHLPLNCNKCSRLYSKSEDFLEFSKCIQNNLSCKLEVTKLSFAPIEEEPTQQPVKSFASSVSTQTSPFRTLEINESHGTPISMINLRWKAKSRVTEEFISDSVSSIKNISSFNNSSIRKSIGLKIPLTKGKLVRSTSTPLQAEFIAKPKEQAFNVSGGHVSSIYNSASDPENSPPFGPQAQLSTPPMRTIEVPSRYPKTRCRGKTSVVVTPLRQVMSKSIQKALAEHGIAGDYRGSYNRKKMFDSVDSSCDISEKSLESTPLDLRLSPAVRRTQSEIIDRTSHLEFLNNHTKISTAAQVLLSSTKKSQRTEAIVITSSTAENIQKCGDQSGNSVYQTCRSVEIITSTSTELSEMSIQQNEIIYESSVSSIPPITPKIPSNEVLTNKKMIKFETPVVVDKECGTENKSPDEVFFTPSSTPVRTSKIKKKVQNVSSGDSSQQRNFYSMEEQENEKIESSCDYTDVILDDEVFIKGNKPEPGKSKLWSLVASVMRLPSLNAKTNKATTLKDDREIDVNSTSLMKRCASFAGSLVRSKSITEETFKAVKRKRTYTNDCNFCKDNNLDFNYSCSESKRFRINGRMPIQRMRCNN